MSRSNLKAALALAYSSGEEPKYVSLTADGLSEMWAIGGVAFLVPAVPADASLELQFALRARRNALLSGRCDECDAVFDPGPSATIAEVSVAGASIPHRGNCPASDDMTEPLFTDYLNARSNETVEAALASASRRTREQLETHLKNRTDLLIESYDNWAQELLDRHLDVDDLIICDHLQANVAQTWRMLLGYTRWYCDECFEYLAFDLAEGRFKASMIEEYTCDYCRRYASSLQPLVVRVGNFVLTGGLCRKCSSIGSTRNGQHNADIGGPSVEHS